MYLTESTSAITAIRPDAKKEARKSSQVARTPPTTGPAKVPIRLIPPKTEIALPRSEIGTAVAMKAWRESPQSAVPIPAATRAAISSENGSPIASTKVLTATSDVPPIIVGRSPRRPTSAPAGTSVASVPSAAAATARLIRP